LVTNNPIDRGNRQTVTAEVFDSQSKQGIPGVNIKGTVTYASLLPIYEFNGKTDANGNFSYSWTIDRDVEPGTFTVVVAATSEQYSLRLVESTMFEVF
jgi:phosphatidate phosphatase APP1